MSSAICYIHAQWVLNLVRTEVNKVSGSQLNAVLCYSHMIESVCVCVCGGGKSSHYLAEIIIILKEGKHENDADCF